MLPSNEVNEYVYWYVCVRFIVTTTKLITCYPLCFSKLNSHGAPSNALDIRSAANIPQTTLPFDLFHCDFYSFVWILWLPYTHADDAFLYRIRTFDRNSEWRTIRYSPLLRPSLRAVHSSNAPGQCGGYGPARKYFRELTFICVMCRGKFIPLPHHWIIKIIWIGI